MRLSKLRPIAGLLKRMLTFSVYPVGDGAAVVLSDLPEAKRAGTVAETGIRLISRWWHFSMMFEATYSEIIRRYSKYFAGGPAPLALRG